MRLPKYFLMKSTKIIFVVSESNNSPKARIIRKTKRPVIRYMTKIKGPALWMDSPDPRNKPVPIVPPIAIILTCRADRDRDKDFLSAKVNNSSSNL